MIGGSMETNATNLGENHSFEKARAAYLATFDRTVTVSRLFAQVTGTIERHETFAEMPGGITTVRYARSSTRSTPLDGCTVSRWQDA